MSVKPNNSMPPPAGYCSPARTAFTWLPWLLLLLTYPLALILPVYPQRVPEMLGLGVSRVLTDGHPWLVYHISLPTLFLVALGACAWLLLTPLAGPGLVVRRRRLGSRFVFAWFVSGIAWCGVSAVAGRSARLIPVVETMGMFVVPLYFATCPRSLIPRKLPVFLGGLWLVNVLHACWQRLLNVEITALAGNPNWAAPLLVGLAPWVVYATTRGRPGLLDWRNRSGRGMVAKLLAAIVVTLCGVLVVASGCRATWVVLAAYAFLFGLLPRLSVWRRAALIVGVCVVGIGSAFSLSDRLATIAEEDIRLPCWAATGRLIADNPVLGVGPGNFRREFVAYRSVEHKRRRVAAAVTEHPHNEVLHLLAAIGIPGTLLWLPALLVLAWPFRRRRFWGLAHFSAFTVVGHAMFDKQLVHPVAGVIGLAMLGLTWRPFLRLRTVPQKREKWASYAAVPLSCVVAAVGLWAGAQHVVTGVLFRRAYRAESRGDHGVAYRAYATSTRLNPEDVRTHTFAGICANNKMGDPDAALYHFGKARELEPDFSHLNGQTGIALGMLGRHEEALAFFERDAGLYPFDADAHQFLLNCRLNLGRYDGVPDLAEKVGDLRYRRIVQQTGELRVRELCVAFSRFVARGAGPRAAAVAGAIIDGTGSGVAEPGLADVVLARPVSEVSLSRQFGPDDYVFWRRAWHWRRFVRGNLGMPVAELVNACVDAGGDVSDVVLVARQAGLVPCLITAGKAAPVAIEIRDGETVWLVAPERRVVLRGLKAEDLAGSDDVAHTVLGSGVTVGPIDRVFPVFVAEFLGKNQALGQVLSRALGSSAPFAGESPAVQRMMCEALILLEQGDGPVELPYCLLTLGEWTD